MASLQRIEKIKSVVSKRQKGLVVVLEDIHDPHNAQAIFRTCDAFGIQDVYLIFEKEKVYNPRKLGKQSSSSAHKWIDFHIFQSTKECLEHLKNEGYALVGTGLAEETRDLFGHAFKSEKLALLVGNEHSGLSPLALKEADIVLKVPMRGMVESLNVSVATALFLFEIIRQRNPHNERHELSAEQQKRLIDDFMNRSSKRKVQ